MKTKTKRLTALALALSLLLTACGGGGATAATMHLRKTQGTVGVSDGEGKSVEPREDLGLYSGYGVDTRSESYAWIDLDEVKLTKLDQDSQIQIEKEGRALTIDVVSGSLFFNVTEPLDDDETLDIRTSTMLVGIRGTCGWVTEDTAALLEGTVSVTAGAQAVTVNAGEMAVLTADGALEVRPFSSSSVPAFVKEEIADDDTLAEEIKTASGIDMTASLEDTYADVFQVITSRGGEVLFAEEIDFEADGSPELLVVYRDGIDETILVSTHRKETEGNTFLGFDGIRKGWSSEISLVESEGRLYVLLYSHLEGAESYSYLGSVAQNDGDSSYWGDVDYVTKSEAYCFMYTHNEQGIISGDFVDATAGEYEAVIQKYTEVRVLVSDG